MALKKHIFLAGMLLLLPLISGCLATIRDNPYGNVNHSVLRGWIFKHIRVPYTRHNPPPLCARNIVLPSVSSFYQNDVFSTAGPYTTNLHNTTVTDIQAYGTIFHIEEPFSGYNFYIELNSNAIGDIAKKHGLSKVYFADIEIFEVFGGIWKHERLHIYGENNQFSEKENSGKKGGENEK